MDLSLGLLCYLLYKLILKVTDIEVGGAKFRTVMLSLVQMDFKGN